MTVIGIGGEPASGKSTLMKIIMSALAEQHAPVGFKSGLMRGLSYGPVLILGLYPEGEEFGGTDRLSMAVLPEVVEFVKSQIAFPTLWKFCLFEGDRLFSAKLFEACGPLHREIYILEASPAEIERRQKVRGNKQSEVFRKGRATKIENIKKKYYYTVLANTDDADLDRASQVILERMNDEREENDSD